MAKKPTTPKAATPAKTATPTASGPDPVKIWSEKIISANKDYEDWAKEYRIERLVAYYLGKHWRGLSDTERDQRYTINLIFATLETQLPSLLFNRPKVHVEPRPAKAVTPNTQANDRATLIESTVQTVIDDPKVHFKANTTLALRDAYSRFGLIEVGYSADWIDNPNADKPVLKDDDTTPMVGSDGHAITHPKKLLRPGSESVYVRRVPPGSFRCAPGRNILEENDWAGYYEWHYVDDVTANPEYEHTEGLKATGYAPTQSDDAAGETNETERRKHVGMVKIWRIWDLRKKERIVLAEGHATPLQAGKPFTFLPFAGMKFYEIGDAYYPLPPIFNWLGPQDEINETREGMRLHRRRFVRRYMREPSVSQAEFDKLESGEDGVCIEVPKVDPPPIAPIRDADLSPQNTIQELAATTADLQQVSGVSGEQRSVPEADTATQANIINVNSQLREGSSRSKVAEWLGAIARLILLTLKDRMQAPFMVKMNVDMFAGAPAQTDETDTDQTWKQIKSEDLGALDVDVSIDIASLSPVTEDLQRQQWTVVLQLFTNQPLMMILMEPDPVAPQAPSPLLRKTLMLNGIKSEREIQAIWRIGQAMMAKASQAAAAQVANAHRPDPPSISLRLDSPDQLADPLVQQTINGQPLQTPPPSALSPDGSAGGAAPALPSGSGPTTGSPATAPGVA